MVVAACSSRYSVGLWVALGVLAAGCSESEAGAPATVDASTGADGASADSSSVDTSSLADGVASDSEDFPEFGPDTGGPDSGGPDTADAAPVDTGPPIPAPPTDLTFGAGAAGKYGRYFITGTLTLPPGASAGRVVQFDVFRQDGIENSGLVDSSGVTSANGTMTYKVTGLVPSQYRIGIRVDQTNNYRYGDPGDYVGYARGTVASPTVTFESADKITIVDAPVYGVDFGLGVEP